MEHEHLHAAEAAFIEGFRAASDKQAFLMLARIPLELAVRDGPGLKLVQVLLEDTVEVGRASRGFASRELVYQPLPATLVTSATRLRFRYISAETVRELSLAEVTAWPETPHDHAHPEAGDHDAPAMSRAGRHAT
jgi:hypothetical protein